MGDDGDFRGGRGSVIFRIPVPDEVRTYVIEAELLYQVLSPRYAAGLFRFDHRLVVRFRALYEAADVTPVRVAHARFTVPR